MKAVYVLMHQRKPNIRELAQSVAASLHTAGIHAHAESWLYKLLLTEEQRFDSTELSKCDAILAVGGDGTLLRANMLAIEAGLPVLGVNMGRVGFL